MILAANKWVATATLICCLLVISCKDGGTPSSFSIGSPGICLYLIQLYFCILGVYLVKLNSIVPLTNGS